LTFTEIVSAARTLLRDPLVGLWTQAELKSYANQCLEDLARDVKYLEDYRDYVLTSDTTLYDIDDDIIEIRRVEYNGKHILPLAAHELYEYDSAWLNESGEIRRWYPRGYTKVGYYKKPSWTADESTFDVEYGMVNDSSGGGYTHSYSSEYGIVVDVESSEDDDSIYFYPDAGYGELVLCDEDALTVNHRVIFTPAALVNDADIPDLPAWCHQGIVYYICWKALDMEGPAYKPDLAAVWQALYLDMKITFAQLYAYGSRTEDNYQSIRPLTRHNKYRHFLTGGY
jgi:hypothetical protein